MAPVRPHPRIREAAIDRFFDRHAPSRRSLPHAQRSFYAYEGAGRTATVKVDFDLDLPRPRALQKRHIRIDGVIWSATIVRANRPTRARFHAFRRALDRQKLRVLRLWVYRTGKGLHVRMWLWSRAPAPQDPPLFTDDQILRFHAILGDDPSRIALNRGRVHRKEEGWSVLWTQKHKNGREVSRERFDRAWTERIGRWLGLPRAALSRRAWRIAP